MVQLWQARKGLPQLQVRNFTPAELELVIVTHHLVWVSSCTGEGAKRLVMPK